MESRKLCGGVLGHHHIAKTERISRLLCDGVLEHHHIASYLFSKFWLFCLLPSFWSDFHATFWRFLQN